MSEPARRHAGLVAFVVMALALAGCLAARPTLSALVVDPTLLAHLPARVAGVAMLPAEDAAADLTSDPALRTSASGIAVGIVIAPGTSGDDDMVTATVVQLRPGVFSDGFYKAWRDDYDEAACAPAGGIASQDRQRIGDRDVDVTLCAEGARLYHARLPGDRLVSITAVGDRRFGDLVMAGLRE